MNSIILSERQKPCVARFQNVLISVYSETLNGTKVTLAAAVGHVTRNIIIQGERTDTNQAGGRVIASVTQVTVGSGAETRTGTWEFID